MTITFHTTTYIYIKYFESRKLHKLINCLHFVKLGVNNQFSYLLQTVSAILEAVIFKQSSFSQVVWRLAHKQGFNSHLSLAFLWQQHFHFSE